MLSAHSKESSSTSTPSRTVTVSSISSHSDSPPDYTRPLNSKDDAGEKQKKFSLDGYNEKTQLVVEEEEEDQVMDVSPGLLPDAVYDAQLPYWRGAVRRLLIKSLKHESRILGYIQSKVRTRFLDSYFLYSSALGSHTFFMSALPALFYFGYSHIGRGLLNIMCLGVYFSSFMKDCFCSPRPFTPTVTRLSIGTHHLEYGFPSTHSTNAMSFVAYLFLLLQTSAANEDSTFGSPWAYWGATTILTWYAASIVLGRLYCGMHSFTDCIVGTLLGSSIGIVQGIYGDRMEQFIADANWVLPVVATGLCLLLTNQHPQPVDDCPCFEDAIASLALLTGTVIARWDAVHRGWDVAFGFYQSRTPGWEGETLTDIWVWWFFAALKMVTGVSAIFAWRLVVKYIMHTALPPIFRSLSGLVGELGWTLPNRRWYTPATEYGTVPVGGMHPIPSSMDLSAELHRNRDEDSAHTTQRLPHAHIYGERNITRRGHRAQRPSQEYVDAKGEILDWQEEESEDGDGERIKHYDADVLTKVIVYSGIGVIATYLTPVTFELLGWGVQPAI